jgi:prepilin-type N-terminal cleavage/methylation domain-containing protein
MEASPLEVAVSRRSRYRDGLNGHTLIELLVVLLVVGVLTSLGMPRFTRAIEQSRVDVAAANLRAIWTAQRLYWLKHQTYAVDLQSLINDTNPDSEPPDNFLDPHVNSPDATYVCEVTSPSATSPSATDFTATATRSGSNSWSGTLSISSDGRVVGSIQDPSGIVYNPSPSSQ